mgnify:CR=1 FL=1
MNCLNGGYCEPLSHFYGGIATETEFHCRCPVDEDGKAKFIGPLCATSVKSQWVSPITTSDPIVWPSLATRVTSLSCSGRQVMESLFYAAIALVCSAAITLLIVRIRKPQGKKWSAVSVSDDDNTFLGPVLGDEEL